MQLPGKIHSKLDHINSIFKTNWRLIVPATILLLAVSISIFWQAKKTNESNKPQITINLMSENQWQHMPGAEQTAGQVKVTGLGRSIVNQDGSLGQDDPPVNIRGPHLLFNSSFSLKFTADQIPPNGDASIFLYSAPPIIYDEWRYQPSQLKLEFSRQKVTIYTREGKSDNWSFHKSWGIQMSDPATVKINFDLSKPALSIQVGQVTTEDIFLTNLLTDKQFWFGADSTVGTSWTLKSFTASGTDIKLADQLQDSIKNPDRDSLKTLAANSSRNLPISTAVAGTPLYTDPQYREILLSQFSMITPENELKAQFVHPQPDVYSFTEADSLVNFALTNHMTVHGHNLVFSEANPKWMQASPLDQRQQIMISHINTVVGYYVGKINEWDVVDEPLNDDDQNHGDKRDLRDNIWFEAMGESYIDSAFQTARSANPQAKLYLNEYGLEADGPRWDEFLSLVKRLQDRRVPIDAVGFQAHVHESGDEIDLDTLKAHIQTLASMGLLSRISEMDVYGDDANHQARQYAIGLEACLQSSSCTSFTTWGFTDKYGSTTEIHQYPLNYGNDLIWDASFQPKPALNSLKDVLKTSR